MSELMLESEELKARIAKARAHNNMPIDCKRHGDRTYQFARRPIAS